MAQLNTMQSSLRKDIGEEGKEEQYKVNKRENSSHFAHKESNRENGH